MATVEELKDYYRDLLILQYRNKTKARGTIGVLAELAIMDKLPLEVKDGFDIDTAEGVQLDILGKWVGIDRYSYGTFSTSDDDFRQGIKLAAIKNNSSSDLYSIQNLLIGFFPNKEILVFDYLGMRMSYFIDQNLLSEDFAKLIVSQGILIRPMGVELSVTIHSENIDRFYGMRTYITSSPNITFFNSYTDYTTDTPWLSYDDALEV